jgi:hypothetical protein
MDTFTFIALVLGPLALFGGAAVWAFGRERTSRFAADARIPFQE